TINSDGTFTYTPAAGFTGTDMFTYTIKNSADNTLADTGTATLNVGNRVWYANNAVANGNGTSASPFNTFALANSAATVSGYFIYLFKGNANYTGGTLAASRSLI